MFFHTFVHRDVALKKSCDKQVFIRELKKKLDKCDIEGSYIEDYGVIVAITFIDAILDAKQHKTRKNLIVYKVQLKAVVFRPFKNQVIDGKVVEVHRVGIFLRVGPMSCFISRQSIPLTMKFEGGIYKDMWDEFSVIDKDIPIRFKILGVKCTSQEMFAVGSLLDDHLGPLVRLKPPPSPLALKFR